MALARGGRKRKPAAEKRAKGNPGKRPIPPEVQFKGGEKLAPPKRWPAGGEERKEWKRIVPELIRCQIAKAVSQGLLEKLCECYASSVTLYQRSDYTGARMAGEAYRKTLAEFGLTPSTASKVGGATAVGKLDDTAEKFFDGPKAVE